MSAHPATLRARFVARRHTALLVAIVSLFAVRPLIGVSGIAPVAFSLALLVLLLVALSTIQVDELEAEHHRLRARQRRWVVVGWALALPALVERLVVLFAPTPRVYLLGAISWLVFFAFVTWMELRSVLQQRKVTGETISMAISIYLLIGLGFALLYIAMFQTDPAAFNLGAPGPGGGSLEPHHPEAFPVFIYFSLTSLATIGFGDITPLSLAARYAAVAEGITGQFYLAILVARLVGLQMSQGGRVEGGPGP